MFTRLPGTSGKALDEIGTALPIGRAASGGMTAAAQSGSSGKETSSPICAPASQTRAAKTAAASARRLNAMMSRWMNPPYAAAVNDPSLRLIHPVQHRLRAEGRAADDGEHLGSGSGWNRARDCYEMLFFCSVEITQIGRRLALL